MTPEEALAAASRDHVPVLLDEVVAAIAPRDGDTIIDGTFGAGGYSRALLAAAQCRVIGVDRDPDALAEASRWASLYGDRLRLVPGVFGALDMVAEPGERIDAVVLDIGVSSMQLDRAARGFSFLRDGALDMRMERAGPSAAQLVNTAEEAVLADILFQYGEERRSRALARAIVAARDSAPIETTAQLSAIIEAASPPKRPGQPHPATRSFQALRIAVNDELGELARGLAAAERTLAPGGRLAVVTFHSLEDRIVKRFLKSRSSDGGAGVSRHSPGPQERDPASFETLTRKPVEAGEAELEANPRARSARLRVARRTDAPARPFDARGIGLPGLAMEGLA
jgi:16S rRNA (cytosine1402-N4)-methyltransferase